MCAPNSSATACSAPVRRPRPPYRSATPRPTWKARANGVRVIAVASGRSDEATLREAGAETVLSDLRDTELLVELICSDDQ